MPIALFFLTPEHIHGRIFPVFECFYWTKAISFIALSFLKDQSTGTNLFIEDCGIWPDSLTDQDIKSNIEKTCHKVTTSAVLCGVDQGIQYKETFIGFKVEQFKENQVGCALACAPYVTLAQNAVPSGHQPADLVNMTIGQWEALGLQPLSPYDEQERCFGIGKCKAFAEER